MIGTAKITTWLPDAASTQAQHVDGAFYAVYVLAALAVILVAGLALTFVMLFRRRDEGAQGVVTRPSLLWQGLFVLGALGLAVFTFALGLPGFVDQTNAPYGAEAVEVAASREGFQFTYANGHVADTLHVATGRPVKLTMTSSDVIHSLQIPAVRVNQAVLPGRTTQAWFNATAVDTFAVMDGVSSPAGEIVPRPTALVSLSPADYEAWMLAATDIFAGRTLPEVGEFLYNSKGCKACHTINGQKLVGPSFQNMFGYEFDTREGVRITVDEAYVTESILKPNVSVIAGYEPVMTPYEGNITEQEIGAVIAWLKTLSDRGGADEAAAAGADTTAAPAPTGAEEEN